MVGFEGLIEMVGQNRVLHRVEVVDTEEFLGFFDPLFGHQDDTVLLVDREILVPDHLKGHFVGSDIVVEFAFGGSGDDERRTRLVDQDRVHFVDDGVVVLPLHHLVEGVFHVVTQVVETELVVGTVGDVGVVLRLAGGVVGDVRRYRSDRVAEEIVDFPHVVGVAFGQIVVDRDDVDTLAQHRVEDDRKGGDEGFTLPRLHFGDLVVVEDHAPDELDVEVAHAHGPLGRFTGDGEGVEEHVVEGLLSAENTLFEGVEGLFELLVVHLFVFRLEGVDLFDFFGIFFQFSVVGRSDNGTKNRFYHSHLPFKWWDNLHLYSGSGLLSALFYHNFT